VAAPDELCPAEKSVELVAPSYESQTSLHRRRMPVGRFGAWTKLCRADANVPVSASRPAA
jgi:hypothetical protein